jgi:hypothetical protein
MPLDLNSAPIEEGEEAAIPDLNQQASAAKDGEDAAEFEEGKIHVVQDQEHNAALNEDQAPFDLNMNAGNFHFAIDKVYMILG